jgi:hypothetical protein
LSQRSTLQSSQQKPDEECLPQDDFGRNFQYRERARAVSLSFLIYFKEISFGNNKLGIGRGEKLRRGEVVV